jgi:hypothetical protein
MNRTIPALAVLTAASALGCGSGPAPRFPLREPMMHDTDLAAVDAPCRVAPTRNDPHHVACAPEPYESPFYWDGADNLVFRGLSEGLGIVRSGEAVNVNSLDEVPDSAWFTNRIGVHSMTPEEVARGACAPAQLLDPAHAADGSWVVDKGKMEGWSPGFRVDVPGKGRYFIKAEDKDVEPERQAASSVIGAAVYHAAGYYSACEQIIYVRPSIFRLQPGLRSKKNFEPEKPFDQRALDALLAQSTHRDGLVRLSASAAIPGYAIGPYRFEGTRDDDPNDVIPHEDRRDLRGMRVLAEWIDRFDAREANTFDTWIAADKNAPRDSSPGYVLHYQLDTSETIGSTWPWPEISPRLGRSYVVDWGDIGRDIFSLGLELRPWDVIRPVPGHEIFGYFEARHFVPDDWKNEYPNPAFSRMTERDAAWMARILAHFTPAMVRALARAGDFSDPSNTEYLATVLEERLERILQRYLTRLSPIGDVHVEGEGRVCGVDFAEMRRVQQPARFHYSARLGGAALAVTHGDGGRVCVDVPRSGDGRYVRVEIEDGVARGALVAYLYDTARGLKLAGIERPAP